MTVVEDELVVVGVVQVGEQVPVQVAAGAGLCRWRVDGVG